MSTSEAYVLVTIPNTTLTSPSSGTFTGRLALEYITFSIPTSSASAVRDVLLVLRLGDDPDGVSGFEAPLDPTRALTATVLPSGARHYVFHATRDDTEFVLVLPAPPEAVEDVELFHSVLAGYATDLRGSDAAASGTYDPQRTEDLRGRFVLVNEDGGEIIGALDRSVRVREDPLLGETGHENDPVVVELPEDDTLDELRNVEVLVRSIPPEDRDWMMRSALFATYASILPFFLPSPALIIEVQPCHIWHHYPSHKRDDLRLELLHRPLDALTTHIWRCVAQPRYCRGAPHVFLILHPTTTTFAYTPSPAVPNDPELSHKHLCRQRRRREAKPQSRCRRRAPHRTCSRCRQGQRTCLHTCIRCPNASAISRKAAAPPTQPWPISSSSTTGHA